MIPPVSASFLSPGFILFLLSFASYPPASAQAVSTPSPQTTYLYFHRTSEHVKLSTPEVFQQVVNEIQGFASANGVAARPEGNAASWEAELPLSAVLDMAHHSGAAYLLYVVVDRPITKWLKVTVQCYETAGHRIWQEDAAEGGLSGGKRGTRYSAQTSVNDWIGGWANRDCSRLRMGSSPHPPQLVPSKRQRPLRLHPSQSRRSLHPRPSLLLGANAKIQQ